MSVDLDVTVTMLFLGFVASMIFLAKYGPHIHSFKLSNYLIMMLPPTVFVLGVIFLRDISILYIYVISAIAGLGAEYAFGKIYHVMMGRRLWEYWKYSIGGYTSLLSLPLWGFAGVFFYLLGTVLTG